MSLDGAEIIVGDDLVILRAWLLDPTYYTTKARKGTNVHTASKVLGFGQGRKFVQHHRYLSYNEMEILHVGADQAVVAHFHFGYTNQVDAAVCVINTVCRELGTPGLAYSEVDPNDSDTCIRRLCLEGRPLYNKHFAIAQPLTLLAYRAVHPEYLLP